jgi:hypothetical protein
MPDLLEQRISTYPRTVPKVAKLPFYTPNLDEKKTCREWIFSRIIESCQSPWRPKIKLPVKSDGKSLRMVHQFIQLNFTPVPPENEVYSPLIAPR